MFGLFHPTLGFLQPTLAVFQLLFEVGYGALEFLHAFCHALFQLGLGSEETHLEG